jgi:hypothetical protein
VRLLDATDEFTAEVVTSPRASSASSPPRGTGSSVRWPRSARVSAWSVPTSA